MVDKYKLTPLNKLTKEIVGKLIFHDTSDSLRRASINSPCIKRVNGSDKVPTIYYVKGVSDPEIEDWEHHVLVGEVSKFILKSLVGKLPEPIEEEEFIHSTITKSEKVTFELEETMIGHDTLKVKGVFKKLELQNLSEFEEPCYAMVVAVTPNEGMTEKYPNAKISSLSLGIAPTEVSTWMTTPGLENPSAIVIPMKIDYPGQIFTFVIKWDETHFEEFTVQVTPDSILE